MKTTENYRLYTVTTNSFTEKQILSKRTVDELEYDYKKVIDNGIVSEIEKKEDVVYFKHNSWEKSLSIDSIEE